MIMGFLFGKDNVDNTEDEMMEYGFGTGSGSECGEMPAAIACDAAEGTGAGNVSVTAASCETEETGQNGKVYIPIHFLETRKYLQQVRDLKRSIRLMENRIDYRQDAGYDISWHEGQLESLQTQLKIATADVAEEISKLHDVNQEVVMTKRYIDVMSWDEIAETSDMKMRTVQKCHGHALPVMEQILLEDGLITLEDSEDDFD